MDYPGISCMCLTFGRPTRILEEAVYSFQHQDYRGEKELLILNDFDQQHFRCEDEQVTVVNVPARFHTVGEKRNAAAALCRFDLLAVWDDDDIYLPHRLTFSMSKYDESTRFFKPSKAFVINDDWITGPFSNLFHGGAIWHRSLFDEVGGYAHMGSGQDMDLEGRFQRVIGPGKDYVEITPEEIFYLYRWAGTHSYHLSGFGRDGPDHSGGDKVLDYATRELRAGRIDGGEIALLPHWDTDYTQLVADHVATLS